MGGMPLHSAGLLPFIEEEDDVRVFIVHMGGPFWGHRDNGGWSLAKGLYVPGEEQPPDAARREFAEEVGVPAPDGDLLDLGQVKLSSGKLVWGFGVRADESLHFVGSNSFDLQTYPEADRGAWFALEQARTRLTLGQVPLLDRLLAALGR